MADLSEIFCLNEFTPKVIFLPKEQEGYLYRFDCLGFGDIIAQSYPIIKHTPCGVWVEDTSGKRKFINNSWCKKFAEPTQALALKAFIKRKEKQVAILHRQLEEAQDLLNLANNPSLRGAY